MKTTDSVRFQSGFMAALSKDGQGRKKPPFAEEHGLVWSEQRRRWVKPEDVEAEPKQPEPPREDSRGRWETVFTHDPNAPDEDRTPIDEALPEDIRRKKEAAEAKILGDAQKAAELARDDSAVGTSLGPLQESLRAGFKKFAQFVRGTVDGAVRAYYVRRARREVKATGRFEANKGIVADRPLAAGERGEQIEAALVSMPLDENLVDPIRPNGERGVNESWVMHLREGDQTVKAVLKKMDNLNAYEERYGFDVGTVPDGAREIIAYEVSNFLGFDLVPPTAPRENVEVDGETITGVTQEWVDDSQPVRDLSSMWKWDPDDIWTHYFAAFDFIIGNADRHNGNALVTEDGRRVAIDHGRSFPRDHELDHLRSGPIAEMMDHPLDHRVLDKLNEADLDALEEYLDQVGFEKGEVEGVMERIHYLLENGQMPSDDEFEETYNVMNAQRIYRTRTDR